MIVMPQFRMPPEIKQPDSFRDVGVAVEHFYNNPDKYGIDKTKIGVEGGSGGGYVSAGTGMVMAEQNKSYMIKNIFMQVPMLDDTIFTKIPHDQMTEMEKLNSEPFKSMYALHANSTENLNRAIKTHDPHLFPSYMSDETLAKFPDSAIITVEFDSFLRETNAFAKRL